MDRLTLFWILHLVFLGAFALELSVVLSIWLRGRVSGLPPDARARCKLWRILRAGLRAIFSPRLPALVWALISDGLIHRKLLLEDSPRWLAHLFVFGSFLLLGALSVITGFVEEILHGMFGWRHPLVMAFLDRDNPILAFLNETLGLILLLGLLYILGRRILGRGPWLRSEGGDWAFLVILLLVVVTGTPVESFRLLSSRPYAATASFGFLGYRLALFLEPFQWPWEELHYIGFFIHFLAASALLLYLPFSKFLHALVSPLVVMANALSDREGR